MPTRPKRIRVQPLKRYKTSRMWNINVNIVLADIVSTSITALVIEAIHARLSSKLAIVTVTAILDGAISIAVFAALHLNANKERGVKDFVRVQVHRWILSPLAYLIGASMQYLLLSAGVRASVGVLIAYLSAVAVVRTIHTLYGKKSGLFH